MQRDEIELTVPYRRPLAGPFPNLHVRQVVKGVVDGIIETITHCQMTPTEQKHFALGFVRGAMTTLRESNDTEALPFAADVLDSLNRGGIEAVRRLVEIVSGRDDVLPS